MDLDAFRYYTEWHDYVNRREYEAPADPWRFVRVDPTAVEYYTSGVPMFGLGQVMGGGWDREERASLAESPMYRGLVQRFEAGADWEETALYRSVEERFADGENVRGYESLAEFRNARCAYLDDLYERISEEGYRPNAEAGHDNPAADDNPWEDAYANHLEPMVAVGRDGELCWVEGFHRLIIAAIAGVDEIPVYVVRRHVEWQRVRDEVGTAPGDTLPQAYDEYGDHPDLADLTSGDG